MQDSREQQLLAETSADSEAAANKLAELRKQSAEGVVELPRAHHFIARVFSEVQVALQAVQQSVNRGMSAKYKTWIRALPAEVAAVIAIRECIQMCTSSTHGRPVVVQDLAISIGKLYETEVRVREAERVNPLYMQRIFEQIKTNCTHSRSHLRKLYNVAYDRVMKGEIDSALNKADLIHIGKLAVQACLDVGLIEQHRGTGSKGTMVYFTLTPEVREFITDYGASDVKYVTDKSQGSMICPPSEWTTVNDGGYLSMRRKIAYPLLSLRNIRASERERLRELFTAENMPEVFSAGNYLQSRKFSIHRPTVEAIRAVWEAGGGILGVPTKNGPKKPECPFTEDWDKKVAPENEVALFGAWKRRMVAYYEKLREWRGKCREVGGFLKVAERTCTDVWFPVYMDRRGRWYYRGTPNPQGSDLSKAVIHFGNKKPLGKEGIFWLKVHIANSYGYDKERFEDRARWTDQNWSSIERALDDPANHAGVFGTDAPWCMFSAAWELREAYRSGSPEGYCSGQIVHMDATCSGLQHFAAILRDPVGGLYVNLSDSTGCGPKQDIYARVASNALTAISRDLEHTDPDIRAIAAWWLEHGIPRKLAKKPVMTYVYGATLRGTAQYIEATIESDFPDMQWPDPTQSFMYSQYAAKKLFQGIAATVPAAEAAMRWLREIARQQPNGKRMEWKTPVGFAVQHDYQTFTESRVKIRSCGLSDVLVRDYNDGTHSTQMQNAIAPNFVHALDASHLTKTANTMKELGLDVVGIHDSFGTHAGDVTVMHKCIRESFVNLYAGRNVLAEFLWDVGGVGEVPMRGTLDLNDILESEFFFC